jgi:hypothetical protein
MTEKRPKSAPEIADEPGWQERFRRGLERALSTPPPRHKPTVPQKPKREKPASKKRSQ